MDIDKLNKQLILHEGLAKFPYVDTVGKISIGVGHNLTDNGLTYSQVMSLLADDIWDTGHFLQSRCGDWFPQLDEVRQRAIFDMAFNLKEKLLQFKKMIAAIKVKDWDLASVELLDSKFARQTGKRAEHLAYMVLTGKDILDV